MGREIREQVKPVARLEVGPIRPSLLSGPMGPGLHWSKNRTKIDEKVSGTQ